MFIEASKGVSKQLEEIVEATISENPLETTQKGKSSFSKTHPVNDSAIDCFNRAIKVTVVKFKGIEDVQIVPDTFPIHNKHSDCEWSATGLLLAEGSDIIKQIMWMGATQPKNDFLLVMNSKNRLVKAWELPDDCDGDLYKYMKERYETKDFIGAYLIKLDEEIEYNSRLG